MNNGIAGGRYITAAGITVDANGVQIKTAVDLQESLQFDDLTVIRGIKENRQNELTALGIRTLEQLADADVDYLVRVMSVSKRTISGWAKQAAGLRGE